MLLTNVDFFFCFAIVLSDVSVARWLEFSVLLNFLFTETREAYVS